ncbi:rhomboid family intramembrane serine protease [Pseudobutyrivibrio xylanivorans]|uniref:Rhomboid family intramembrane serine protease n=1 Tax=Pseudobutyrivibrio xylanivorans TaxID=185007 RepID=A0A1G5RU98_PSEXY|nr:rhomboid family intramembrane serine protease [Pseudobutyrivibrio xylanivorans]SCZ77438.1 hypothetical protein SAMN02910350_00757 [Pseudobutyrivibrio xylanivorans]
MLDKLEKKFGKYAIHNLTIYLLAAYAIGYLLEFGQQFTGVPYLNYIWFEPYLILKGQVWRLFTWVLIPPSNTNIIFAVIMFILYYQLGTALERTWGAFRFNVYIFGGMLFTVIGAFIMYLFVGPLIPVGGFISTYYINLSIFLAFSVCYPDLQVMLYFIIPIKMKWMSIFYLVIVGYSIVQYIAMGWWFAAMPIVASLLNWFIFFMMTKNLQRYNPKDIHRRAEFRRQATPPRTQYRDGTPIARHKCAVCGRTEISNPELEFRFCSKCNGNYEYCSEHLFTHQHIKNN